MIAEIGHAVLWIAAALALLQIIAGTMALRGQVLVPVRPLAVMHSLLISASPAYRVSREISKLSPN